MSVPYFKRDGSIYPVLLEETGSLVMYHSAVEINLVCNNYVYTKLFKSDESPISVVLTILKTITYCYCILVQ